MPKDPVILLSYVNMLLRDKYSSLDNMKDDLGSEADTAEQILNSAGYVYDKGSNSFVYGEAER